MMSMQTSRKGCRIEKVENPTALQPRRRTLPKTRQQSDHACAIFATAAAAEPARSFAARGNVKAQIARKAKRAEGHASLTGHAAVSHWPACTPCQI
jgi:hypothetical protein